MKREDILELDTSFFKVQKVWREGKLKKRLLWELLSESPKIKVILAVNMDTSPETIWSMEIINEGKGLLLMDTYFPVIGGIRIGDLSEDNFYIHPQGGGTITNLPFYVSASYNGRWWMQIFDVYNPFRREGLYGWVRDPEGKDKIFHLRKVDDPEARYADYHRRTTLGAPRFFSPPEHERRQKKEIFNFEKGWGIGIQYFPRKLQPKESFSPPSFTLGVHRGDFRGPLKRYRKWVNSWYTRQKTPLWYKHSYKRNGMGWPEHYHPDFSEKGKYVSHIKPWDDIVGFSRWANWAKFDLEGNPQKRWNQWTYQNFIYERGKGYHDNYNPLTGKTDDPNWGGIDTFRSFIRKIREEGVKTSLYFGFIGGMTMVKKLSPLGLKHGGPDVPPQDDWAMMERKGKYLYRWGPGGKGAEYYWNFCPGVKPWQEEFSRMIKRVVMDTQIDEIYLDVLSTRPYYCFNPRHHHPTPDIWAKALGEFLTRVRKKIEEGRKEGEAVLSIERVGSDYLSQFVDGALDRVSLPQGEAFWSPVGPYGGVSLFRFVFPEFKIFSISPQEKLEDYKVAFFEGEGMHGSFEFDTPQLTEFFYQMVKVLKQNSDAFQRPYPEPLIPAKSENIGINKFSSPRKVIYAVYNPTYFKVKGEIFEVPNQPEFHWVELLNHTPLFPLQEKEKLIFSLEILPYDVLAVAGFPRLIDVRLGEKEIKIKVKGRERYPGSFLEIFGIGEKGVKKKILKMEVDSVRVPFKKLSPSGEEIKKVVVKFLYPVWLGP